MLMSGKIFAKYSQALTVKGTDVQLTDPSDEANVSMLVCECLKLCIRKGKTFPVPKLFFKVYNLCISATSADVNHCCSR